VVVPAAVPPTAATAATAALLVSSEYTAYAAAGKASRLPGCAQDTSDMFYFLTRERSVAASSIRVLCDAPEFKFSGLQTAVAAPSRAKILESLDWLVEQSKTCTHVYLHYSGHGSFIRDAGSDELDGNDEAIVPCDYLESGLVTDDVLKQRLVDRIAASCKLVALFDSCHSGTVLDLARECVVTTPPATFKAATKAETTAPAAVVVALSGCMDSQTSASAYRLETAKPWQGAMTYAFLSAVRSQREGNLLNTIRKILRDRKFSQVPLLCCSRDLESPESVFY
jgi:metacaspase-1